MSTKENARRFIKQIANDDDFRAQVERDPVAALALHGFTIDPTKLPANGVTLPSKDVLHSREEEMSERFADACDIIIHFMV